MARRIFRRTGRIPQVRHVHDPSRASLRFCDILAEEHVYALDRHEVLLTELFLRFGIFCSSYV